MTLHRFSKGLDLPIAGAPEQRVESAAAVSRAGLAAADHPGLKPSFFVKVGDVVKRGQPLFADKKREGVRFTAPGAGKVAAIHRGEQRALLSVVIDLSEGEQAGDPPPGEFAEFASFSGKPPAQLEPAAIEALLVESGLWTAFRARPFGKTAIPGKRPKAMFVTAIDTNPLAPDLSKIVSAMAEAFRVGLECVAKLSGGKTYLCKAPGWDAPVPASSEIQVEEFDGPHPAGLPGTHIHALAPAGREREVWHIGAQDVIAIGQLFATGRLDVERIVALGGPAALRPRLLRTRLGASLDELTAGELQKTENRVISGSVFHGRSAMGDIHGYLGRYDSQVSALEEGRQREFLGWLAPGAGKFSILPAFLSYFLPKKSFRFTTSLNGSGRAMVPIGAYERVCPLDIIPTYLLRALITGDLDMAEKLGCLELDEEDMGLFTFVCPSKIDWAPKLRRILDELEKEME